MNLINRLHLFAAASRDIVLHRGRKLEFVTDNATTEIVNESSAVCNFNLTDNFLANDENIEVYMYEAGEVCSFALTTISYITEPMSAQIYNGDNSNTFEIMDSHHLAVMKSDGTGVVYCIHDAATLANSTQHRDGSATFSIKSGDCGYSFKYWRLDKCFGQWRLELGRGSSRFLLRRGWLCLG